jgi:hypothetical protein
MKMKKRHRITKVLVVIFTAAIIFGLTTLNAAAEEKTADDAAELAKKLSNPIAALISVPIKLDYDTGSGHTDADRFTYTIQPVIPFGLNDKWNVISRTIVPVHIDAESPVVGGSDTNGMGDILQSFFISPKAPTARGWIWGAGPALALPTGSDGLTTDKFSVGPTAVVLKQVRGWTYGALANHLWSVSGDDDRSDVNATFLQPFLAFNTKTHTTLSVNTESSYDWTAEEWTVLINLTVSQLVKVGKQPISLQVGYRNYVDAPPGGPDWGLRFQVTFLFPK